MQEFFAKLFIKNRLSFNSTNSPLLKQIIYEIHKYPSYMSYSSKQIRIKDLKKLKENCVKQTNMNLEIGLRSKGIIILDGWTNLDDHFLINILIVCSKKEYYRKLVDCGA